MTFSFNTKSFQKSEDSNKEFKMLSKISGLSGAPEKIQYISKANIDTINERGADDLTGASYVSDIAGFSTGNAVCVGVVYGGQLALNAAAPGSGTLTKVLVGTSVGHLCNETIGKAVDNMVDYLQAEHGPGADAESSEHGHFGIEEPDNNQGDGTDTDTHTDPASNDYSGDGDSTDEDSDEDGLWDSIVEAWESFWGSGDPDGNAGGDEGNPNPYAEANQGSTSKPKVGPAPGDIGGRYSTLFNPGAERGFTPGNDGDGDGNPGNPWDRNERMSTPNDNGGPVDPVTGTGAPRGPKNGGGGPVDPDEDYNYSALGDDLWKPNPDDIWGGGPNSKVVGIIQTEADKSMVLFVTAMSAETSMA